MTNLNSVSDLARSYQLRLSQSSLKAKLDTLTQETTTGVKADIPKALGGDVTRITQIEARLAQLKAHGQNLSEAQGILSGMQAALGSIRSAASSNGTILLSEALISSDPALQMQVGKAPDEFRAVLGALNTSVAGRFIFSGSRTDQPAVVGYDAIMQQIGDAVGGATDPAEIVARIDTYFSAAGGFSQNGYLGDDTGSAAISVAPGRQLTADLTANADELRQVLKGFAILSYAAQNGDLGSQTVRALSRAGGTALIQSEIHVTAAQSSTGIQEETAARIKTANEAELSALTIARNSLIAADPYESAAALKEVEANIETLYTLTARLSKLSLTDYL